jgi:PAS domain S-box-containing protein
MRTGPMIALILTSIVSIAIAAALALLLKRLRRELAQIKESESRLRFAVEVSDIGVFDRNHASGEIYRSPELYRQLGFAADGRGTIQEFIDRVHPEDRAAVLASIQSAHDPQGSGRFAFQFRIIGSDDSVRWVDVRSLTTFAGEGASRRAHHTIGTVADFTERRRIDEALRQSGERLRQVLRVSHIGVFDHDHDRDDIYWSRELRETYGFTADEPVTLQEILARAHPDDRAMVAAAVARAHDPAGDGFFDVEHRIVRRDGETRWLVTRSRTLFSADSLAPRPTRTVGAVLDVTDRHLSERELRQRQQIHSAVVSQSAEGIALVDRETLRFVEFNDAACAMLRYSRDAFAALRFPDLAPNAAAAERIPELIAASSAGGDFGLAELKRCDGSLLPVWLTSRAVTHQDRTYLAIVWRDTTERGKVDRVNRQLASLVQRAQVLIAVATLDSRPEFINDFGRAMIGLGANEGLEGRSLEDFADADDRERVVREILPAVLESGRWSGELSFRRLADGAAIPTLSEIFRIDDINGQPMNIAAVSRDITELKKAEVELRRLNSVHLALSHTNQSIVRVRTEAELFARICDIVVEDGGFALAWIGLLQPDGFLRVLSAAGPASSYVEGLRLSADEQLDEGRGPAGRALRSGMHVIVDDAATSDLLAPWRERTRLFGIRSSGAFPLLRSGRVIGILSVHSSVPRHFGEREISLLDDMAADISFGLESLHRATALDRSLEMIRDIEATVRVGAIRLMLPDWSLWWSEGTPVVLGLRPTTAADRESFEAAFDDDIALILMVALGEAAQSGDAIDIDLPLRVGARPGRWIRLYGVPKRGDGGKTEISCTLQDISERKRLEAELLGAADGERRRLASELHDNLGQLLCGASLLLASVAHDAAASESALSEKIASTTAAMNEAMQVCRTLAHGAAPIVEGGLSAALRELAARTSLTSVACEAVVSDSVNTFVADASALELYRIAQEGVTNALKHARCRRIEIRLVLREMALELSIHDDGDGFDLATQRSTEGIGLRTMRYRAARAGGTLEFRSGPGQGTTLRVLVPLFGGDAKAGRGGV